MSTDADVFPGVLRCAEPGEYQDWLGVAGSVPKTIVNPLKRFCFAAPDEWCREQRAAGCCHLNDQQFRTVMLHHRVVSLHEEREEPQDMVTRPTRPAPVRLIDTPAPLDVASDRAEPSVQWEPWVLAGRDGEPILTVDVKAGAIRVNVIGDHLLSRPEYVQLVACRAPRMVGLRVVSKGDPGAITVRGRTKAGGFNLSCRGFLKFYGIELEASRRWKAAMVNGALAINLDAASLPEWGSKTGKAA